MKATTLRLVIALLALCLMTGAALPSPGISSIGKGSHVLLA